MFLNNCFLVFLIMINLANFSESVYIDPTRFQRSNSFPLNTKSEGDSNGEGVSGQKEKNNMVAWLHGHITKIGNASESDLQAIMNSMKLMSRPESTKFPRLKVFNYKFDNGDTREILVYDDPDEEKQWMVTIEDLDLRQNLIVFRMGDLGFGFAKANTYVVLRRSVIADDDDSYHYINLAYIQPRKKAKGYPEVEWDIIKPGDLYPIPLLINEREDDHEEHCDPRKCGLKEYIFGTCPIVKLTCEDLRKLPLEGHEKERIEALLREKQPFIYELAKSLSINKKYLEKEGESSVTPQKVKRSVGHHGEVGGGSSGDGSGSGNVRFGEGEIGHHSVKKDHAAVAVAFGSSAISSVEASMQAFQRKLAGERSQSKRSRAPAVSNVAGSKTGKEMEDTESLGLGPGAPLDINRGDLDPTGQINIRISRASKNNETSMDKRNSNWSEGLHNKTVTKSDFDQLLLKKSPVVAANLTLGIQPIQSQPQLPPEEKSYFENVLDKIRNSPPSKYTVRPYECVSCEPIGTFMAEYAENPLVSYVVNNLMGDIFRDVVAKRNLFSPEANEVLQEHAKIPYVGYGFCEYSVDNLDRSPKSMEYDDIIDFYSETLALSCEKKDCESQRPRVRMRELLTSKYRLLEIWPDLSVRINKNSDLPKNLLLSTSEFRLFMVSLIFSAYTTEYRMQLLDHTDDTVNKLPNHHMSPRMRFQTRMILRVVDELVKSFPHHIIKGLKFLLQVLQEKYLALVAEQLGILEFNFKGNEKERAVYKTINKSDRFQVLALKDFLLNGVAPVTRSGAPSLPAFATFFTRNHKRIINMVIDQGIGHEHHEHNKVAGNRKQVRSAEVESLWADINGQDRE